MNKIAVECPHCRRLQPVPASVLLVDLGEPDDDETCTATVWWVCATCSDLASLPVDWEQLMVLLAAGVDLLKADTDDLVTHPETAAGGAPLTPDDLLELHECLSNDSWFDELTCQDPPPIT
jgi:hypothetical protein